ncbi:mitochondrial 39-S ribosomal protein L47 [Thraustotheca clavata]|uniref:Large ribosomal subunit protein uL29m n=1 Tax=Thraustotheca clavata TaxID=74557 RepID=A0A1V9ZQU6_9STRA|nr:mitochondrial 39-S ribosomal protein L47 [Thraustotheca clavata]
MFRRIIASSRSISTSSFLCGIVKKEGVPTQANLSKRVVPELNGTIDQFFPTMSIVDGKQVKRAAPVVGGDWKAWMLRNKSTEDLHKLWYVLLKERNALLTEQAECRARNMVFPNPFRKSKVRKSMARIKLVLHERSLVYKANQDKQE